MMCQTSPLNFTQHAVLLHNIKIGLWPQITVMWLHHMHIV